jgi:hypothetical protein
MHTTAPPAGSSDLLKISFQQNCELIGEIYHSPAGSSDLLKYHFNKIMN